MYVFITEELKMADKEICTVNKGTITKMKTTKDRIETTNHDIVDPSEENNALELKIHYFHLRKK